jgi:hypothetical protein
VSTRDEERHFLSTVSGWIVSLPHDLKLLFEAKDDPNLEREARELAAGAILHALSADTSGDENFVSFADKAIILRAALRAVAAKGGEGSNAFRERFEDVYQTLDADLTLCQKVMGDSYDWVESRVASLGRHLYKGQKVAQYLDDDEESELLYEDGLAFATEYPIDEDKLGMRLKKPETLLDPLRRRAADDRKKVAG